MNRKRPAFLRYQSKRILVYGQVPPPFHGSNLMTQVFLKSLTELGFRAKLFNKMYSKEIREVNRIRPLKFFRYLTALGRYSYNLLLFKPDFVVFFISATHIGLLAESIFIFLTNMFKIPYVHYIHANGHLDIYSQGGLGRKLVHYVFKNSKACLVLGKVFQKDLEHFYDKRIYILPNCLLDIFPEKRIRTHSRVNVLFLSNLYETKGIFTLVKSIPLVIAKNKNVCFKIAGPWQESSLKKRVLDYIKKHRLKSYLDFLGPVYRQKKAELYSLSDVFVFPSHYKFEAFGLVNLEAMQAGIPVITTSIGALPEMVIDGQTGFIIPPKKPEILAERINSLVENAGLRKKMGSEGRKRFEALYSYEAYTSNVSRIMCDLLF